MTKNFPRLMPLLLLIAACGEDQALPLTASDVAILAPLPGQSVAVAYLSLRNQTAEPIVITHVSSPEFAEVQMHTTVYDDGIAEMLSIDSITVAGQSAIEFTIGGKHLMLMEPEEAFMPGDDVTLEFHYGSDGLLTLRAPLRMRNGNDVD